MNRTRYAAAAVLGVAVFGATAAPAFAQGNVNGYDYGGSKTTVLGESIVRPSTKLTISGAPVIRTQPAQVSQPSRALAFTGSDAIVGGLVVGGALVVVGGGLVAGGRRRRSA